MKSKNKKNPIKEFFKFTFKKRIFALLIFSEMIALFLIPSTLFWELFLELFWALFIIILIEFPLLTIAGTLSIFLMYALLVIIFLVINYFLASFIVRLCINIKKLRNPLIRKVSIFGLALFILFVLFFPLDYFPLKLNIIKEEVTKEADVEIAWDKGCTVLRGAYSCDAEKVSIVNTTMDVTGDGVADNLLTVCRIKFKDNKATKYFCRNQCCGLSPMSPCEKDKDCASPYYYTEEESNWICDTETRRCKKLE